MLEAVAMLSSRPIPLLWCSHSPFPLSPTVNKVLARDTFPDILDLIRKQHISYDTKAGEHRNTIKSSVWSHKP